MPHSKTIAVCLILFLCDIFNLSDKSDILLDHFVNLHQKPCDSIYCHNLLTLQSSIIITCLFFVFAVLLRLITINHTKEPLMG